MRGNPVAVRPSRALCGTTEPEFGLLLEQLAPLEEAARRARQDRPGRLRAPGAGRRPKPFWLRLLVALTQLRQNTPVRATAQLFGVHERSVRSFRDEVVGLLAAHGCRPPGAARPVRTPADLVEYLDGLADGTVIVDGTEVQRSRPVGWGEQRRAWSGKSRSHVVKGTVVADAGGRPAWFEANPTGEGRRHGVTVLRAQALVLGAPAATTATVLADLGCRDLHRDLGPGRVLTPVIKPPNGALGPEARRWNRELSARRMRVEHAIGRMKTWRAMRYWRRPVERFDETGKAVAVLASIL